MVRRGSGLAPGARRQLDGPPAQVPPLRGVACAVVPAAGDPGETALALRVVAVDLGRWRSVGSLPFHVQIALSLASQAPLSIQLLDRLPVLGCGTQLLSA